MASGSPTKQLHSDLTGSAYRSASGLSIESLQEKEPSKNSDIQGKNHQKGLRLRSQVSSGGSDKENERGCGQAPSTGIEVCAQGQLM